MASKTTSPGESRTLEEAVHYGLGHRIRAEVQAILHEGPHSASELAKLTHQGLSKIGHHIKELADSRRIELARVDKSRNTDLHIYRAVKPPDISDEEARAMPFEERQEIAAVILEAITAESLAALWAGKLSKDPVWMSWRWFHFNKKGQWKAQKARAEFWKQMEDIELESLESGEKTTSTIVSLLGFERFRPVGRNGPATSMFRSPLQGNTD